MAAPKKRGLGRGLDALLGMQPVPTEGAQAPTPATEDSADGELRMVPLAALVRGRYQPRIEFDDDKLEELADSIRAQGVVQPIVVRPQAGGRFEVIAGERRWRASERAGLSQIPALVRELADDAAMSIALIENIQREQLNPVEEARALVRLVEEFKMTHQEVARAIGRSRSAVSNLLRLLELDDEVRQALESGAIEMGHARALLGLPAADQRRLAAKVAEEGLSVRVTEKLVRELGKPKPAQMPAAAPVADPNIAELEARLSETLGARVAVRAKGGKGGGTVTISFNSLDELDGILGHIT